MRFTGRAEKPFAETSHHPDGVVTLRRGGCVSGPCVARSVIGGELQFEFRNRLTGFQICADPVRKMFEPFCDSRNPRLRNFQSERFALVKPLLFIFFPECADSFRRLPRRTCGAEGGGSCPRIRERI